MSTHNDISRHAEDLKVHASEAVRKVSDQINQQAGILSDTVVTVRYNTQEFIENNPWQAVIVAAGIGFLVGVVVSRR